MKRRAFLCSVISIGSCLLVLLTGCSGGDGGSGNGTSPPAEAPSDGALASALIMAATGGTVTVPPPHPLAGTAIAIPAGALIQDTTISIHEATTSSVSGVVGPAFDIEPDGTTFSIPATVTIVYDEAALPPGMAEETLSIALVGVDDVLTFLANTMVDTEANTVSGETPTLSVFAVVAVTPENSPPVANSDMATTPEDTAVTIAVLANDTDPDGHSLTVDGVTQGANGEAMTNGSEVTYAPNSGFQGTETFTYTVCDNGTPVLCATATVTVTVTTANSPPVANAGPDQTVSVGETVQLNGSGSNDRDDNPLTFQWSFVVLPTGSTATLSDVTVVAPSFVADVVGTYEIQLIVNDGIVESMPATVTISALPRSPETVVSCEEGIIAEPIQLRYGDHSTGCRIEPAAESDSFTFIGTETDIIRTVVQGTSPNLGPRFVLLDPQGTEIQNRFCQPCTSCVCTVADEITLMASGTYTLIVSDNDFRNLGTYTLQLERIPSFDPLPITYDTAVTDAIDPATDQDFFAFEGKVGATIRTVVQGTSPNLGPRFVLLDPQGTEIQNRFCQPCTSCVCTVADEITLMASGTYTLIVSDNDFRNLGTYTATVQCLFPPEGCTIAPHDLLISPGSGDFGNVPLDSPSPPQAFTILSIGREELTIGTIEIIGPNASEFSLQNDTCSQQTVPPSARCTLEVVLTPTDFGAKTATLTVSSNDSTSPILDIPLTGRGGNSPPVANDDMETTEEDTPVIVNVLANDTDPDEEGTVDPTTVTIGTEPSQGTVAVNANGTVTYTPAADVNGMDTFTYTVADDDGARSNVATVTVTIIPINDPPVANDDTAVTDGNTPVILDLLANDTDDNQLERSSVTITTEPQGTVDVDLTSGVVTYTPPVDFFGIDTFTYTVDDSTRATSNVATVTVRITPIRLGPSLVAVDGYQLLVQQRQPDGTLASPTPYIMRGVVWPPASPETDTAPDDPHNANVRRDEFGRWYATDIPLMTAMHVNTVRLVIVPGVDGMRGELGMILLDTFYNNNIMVIMTVDDGVNDIALVEQAVSFYKEHPAILMWMLGSEWNINLYFGVASSVVEAAQHTEEAAALIKTLDLNHPVATSYGDIDIDTDGVRLSDTARYVNEVAPSVDVWGLNIYRGKTFGTVFEQWASITAKPLFLGEFGTDAFSSTALTSPPPGAVDETAQEEWVLSLWNDLFQNLSAHNPSRVALGGTVFAWNDEWWKVPPAGSQETGGFILRNGHPDGFANEEYFGIVTIDREPRRVYNALQTAFDPASAPSPRVVDFSTLPERVATNLATFFVSGAAPSGSQVTVNRISISTGSDGSFVIPMALAVGDNVIELVIESAQGVTSTFTKTIHFDPELSTAERRLLYVDSVVPSLLGTIVIDVEKDLFLGLLDEKHVRGIAPHGEEIYMQDRSVISTATHQESEAPFSPLNFSADLATDAFLVSPDGTRLYAGDEILDLLTNQVREEKLPVDIVTGSSFGGFRAGGPAISADGQTIFCRENPTFLIHTVDNTATNTGIASGGGTRRFVSDLALSPDGRVLLRSAYNFANGLVDIFDAVTFGHLATRSGLGDFVGEIVFSADGQKAIVGSAGNPVLGRGGVTVIDTLSFEQVFRLPLGLADNVAISDQDEVFVSSSRLGIDVFALQDTGTLVRTKTFFLGINRTRNEIQKIIFKP